MLLFQRQMEAVMIPIPTSLPPGTTAYVVVRSHFTALHRWENQPGSVYADEPDARLIDRPFLRYPHRHKFLVEVTVQVTHSDRDVEFFQLKEEVDQICLGWDGSSQVFSASCEMFAAAIGTSLQKKDYKVAAVKVSEDGESDGVVVFS